MSEVGLPVTELDTPVLWVDLDRLQRNIHRLASHFRAAGVQWRPHTKGIKIPAIAHMLLDAGAIGVTCAKLGEAEVMVAAGIRDILIANQVVGPQKYVRLANLQRQADVKIAVDSAATLDALGAAAMARQVEIGVVIELLTGMNRAGVQPGEAAVELARAVDQTPGLALRGLMSWEGHVLSCDTEETKRQAIEESIGVLTDNAQRCRKAGLPIDIVSCGGSGTYGITAHQPGITEIQAGGAIFNDVSYLSWGVPTEPAIFVRSTVTSRPAPDRIIFDAGFKALPVWLNPPKPLGIDNVSSISMSAEHGVVRLDRPNHQIRVGDAFDFMLGYGDMTVFLHDQLYGVRDGIVEVAWSIAGRGRLR